MPSVTQPERFRLEVELHCDKSTLPSIRTNDWDAWAYPPRPPPVAATVPVFASAPLFPQLSRLGTIPHLKPWPAGQLPSKAVYLVQQTALALPELTAAVHAGTTAVMISWDHHNDPANSTMMPAFQPRPVVYHSPTWMEAAQTPAAVLATASPTTPQALVNMTAPSGWADASFFEGFGPLKGRCNWRVGTLWDLSHGTGPLPPGPEVLYDVGYRMCTR